MGYLGPHFPGAGEQGGSVKEALEVLRLGLIPWEGEQTLLQSSFVHSLAFNGLTMRLITERLWPKTSGVKLSLACQPCDLRSEGELCEPSHPLCKMGRTAQPRGLGIY